MQQCQQCNKPAVVSSEDESVVLCADCVWKTEKALQMHDDRISRRQNDLLSEMEATAGLPRGFFSRYETSKPMIYHRPTTYNNINVDRSTIGAINTGEVDKISVAMEHIKNGGNEELAGAIKQFTEAVLKESQLVENQRREILEQLSFLASQATQPKPQRSESIIRKVVAGIKETTSAVASLATIWTTIQPILEKTFFN